jgi:hypothetical protein
LGKKDRFLIVLEIWETKDGFEITSMAPSNTWWGRNFFHKRVENHFRVTKEYMLNLVRDLIEKEMGRAY